jgi:putative sporulation protein YyaC
MEYSFHLYNKLAADGAAMALDKLLNLDLVKKTKKTKGVCMRSDDFSPPPVIVCIGSDLAIGDSLGPITGSMIKYKTQGLNAFLYGTLASPVTAKEIKYIRTFLKETHKGSQIVAIDAAIGDKGDIGLIKLSSNPLFPGAGANKQLGSVGDISIMGIVAEKSIGNYGLLNTTRLNLVYTMSEIISDAVSTLLWNREEKATKNA